MSLPSYIGCIQVSETTQALLSSYTFRPTGGIEVKGKVIEGEGF